MSEPTPTAEPETASAAQVDSHAQAESHAQADVDPQPVVIHPGEDFDLLGPAEAVTGPRPAAEPATPSLDELVEAPVSTELPPVEAEPTTEFVASPEAAPEPEPEPEQAAQAEQAPEPHRSEPEADPEPAFSHPRALPDDIDDDYDPDAETVMRVKPIDLSHEEDEHDGR